MKPRFSKSRIALALSAGCFALHSVAQAATYYWDNNTTTAGFGTAGGTWTAPTVSQWSTDLTGVAAPGASITTTTSDVLNFGTASVGLAAGTITVSGTVSANSLTYGSASGAILLSGGIINLGGTTPTITVNNTTNTISSGITGSAGLTKAGTGALMIQVGSAYTGATTINGGKLQINNNSGSVGWTPGLININNGSTLEFTGTSQTIFEGAGDNITFGSGGGGSIVMTRNTIWRSASIITTGGAKNTVSGTYFNGQGSPINRVIYGVAVGTDLGGIDLEVSSGHTNVGGITKNGSGTLALTNNVNGMGAAATIIINAGTVEIGGAGRLQSGSYAGAITNNGTFNYNSSAAQTLSGVISGNGALVKSNASTLTLSGANTYTGATTISAGTLALSGGSNVLADTSAVNLTTTGASLDISSVTTGETIGSLTGVADTTVVLGTDNLTVGDTANTTFAGIISGASGSLTKNGTGTLTLSGANTYTGATTVSGGKLSIASTGNISSTSGISIGAAELNYNSSTALSQAITFSTIGGKLSGNGTITPATTISAGNTLAPGNSIGTLSFGTGLTIAGTYSVELGTAGATAASGLSDRAAVTGDLTLTGSTLELVDNAGANSQGSAGAGAYRIATFTGSLTGTFGTVTNPLSASLHEVVSYGAGVVDLSLYRLATATAPSATVNLGNVRVGGTLAGSASITNTAASDGFSELLKATVTGDGTGFTGVAGGASGTVNYSLSTATAGSKSGSASVVLQSTGVGTYGDTTLNTTTVNLSGGVYNAAAANTLSAVNLGKIRAGGSFSSSALTITNTSAAGAFTEGLNATKGSTTGSATVSGLNISDLAGLASSTAISVGLGSGNMTAGAYSGNVSIDFASNGTNSGLSDLGLNSQSLTVTGAVYDYATADFTKTAGVGALTKTNTYSYTFNFGSGLALNTEYTASFSLANGALNVQYKDALGGSYSSIGNGFSTTAGAFGTNTSNSLASGGSNSFDITFNTGSGGLFNETLTFSGLSQQSGLTDASLGNYTFALSAVAIPEPDVAVLLGGLGMLTLLRRRRA
jgi:autotransporter-associated beta strand protein